MCVLTNVDLVVLVSSKKMFTVDRLDSKKTGCLMFSCPTDFLPRELMSIKNHS